MKDHYDMSEYSKGSGLYDGENKKNKNKKRKIIMT